MKYLKNKKVIFVGLVVLLVLTGYLNFRLNSDTVPASADETTLEAASSENSEAAGSEVSSAFFADFRAKREASRENELKIIETILANQSTDEETLADAQQQKLEIAKSMEKEVTIEGLLRGKGFAETVVTLHTGSVNVVVDSQELTSAQVAQIVDIVAAESGEKVENIKVIPKK